MNDKILSNYELLCTELDNITTNLSNDEIANLYSERVASRVRTGLEGNYFKVFGIKDKRYSIG